jgi:hypothetical protein
MKKKLAHTLTATLILFSASVWACHIEMETSDTPPAVGEEAVLTLQFRATHHNCSEPLSSIKIKADGMTILGATEWEKCDGGVYERKLKVKISDKACSLKVYRSCRRGGLDEEFPVRVAD